MTSENPQNPVSPQQPTADARRETEKHSAETQPAITPALIKAKTQMPAHQYEVACNTKRDWIDKITLGFEAFGLAVLVVYTIATIVYACLTRGMWKEMQEQTRLQRQAYITSQRPWVRVKNRIAKPLTFDTPAWKGPVASATIEDILENTGTTVALNVLSWEDIIPLDSNGGYGSALKRRSEWCDANRHPDEHGLSGFVLFPKDSMAQDSTVGPPMETVKKAASNANSSPGLLGRVGFVLVGCVAYRSSFEPKADPTHQTRFIYFLGHPENGGMMPYVLPQGVAGGLQLIAIPDGFSAD